MRSMIYYRHAPTWIYFYITCVLLFSFSGCSSSDDPVPEQEPGQEQRSLGRALDDLRDGEYKIWLCAHRANTRQGISTGIPENSLPAVSAAIAAGADIIETDVRCTANGALVIMHDNTVDRTTNGTGSVSSMSLEAIRGLRLKDSNGTVTAYTVPTLEEFLLAGKGKVYFNLDIASKNVPVSSLVNLLKKLDMTDRVMLYVSTDRNLAYDLVAKESSLLIHPLVQNSDDITFFSRRQYNVQVMQLSYSNAASGTFASQISEAGAVAFSNITGSNNQGMLAGSYSGLVNMINKRVCIVQTDYTEVAAEYLAGKGLR